MALKSNREGLRKELVDYLGNIIIDKKLKQDIINSINDVFVNESDVLSLEEILASSDLSGKIPSASALKNYIKVRDYTATTNSSGNIETYNFPRLINATCISPNYGAVSKISNFNGIPSLFYVVNALTGESLVNKEVTIRFITY